MNHFFCGQCFLFFLLPGLWSQASDADMVTLYAVQLVLLLSIKFQVKLHFTENALRLIAKKAMAKNTGARGLRAILENILTEAMFEVYLGPSIYPSPYNLYATMPSGFCFVSCPLSFKQSNHASWIGSSMLQFLGGFWTNLRPLHGMG